MKARARVYNAAIVRLTASWYGAVLDRLPQGCRLLDVGIGTGAALLANTARLVEKDVRVCGVDIDATYVDAARRAVSLAVLSERVEVRLESVYDHCRGPYDAVYFSASFMLLPDPPEALRHVGTLLAPGGRIYFTQTFEDRRARLTEIFKPLLRFVTSIDFGRVTYEADFRRALANGAAEIEELTTLSSAGNRSSRLAVARVDGVGEPSG
jgi:SAM-dependent methyltransferase